MSDSNTAPPPGLRGRLRALGLDRRELRSWALYDWANSAFATTIMAAVLPIYYARVAAADLPGHVATAYWGYTASLSVLVIALLSPVLGAMADVIGAKKRLLAAFMSIGVLASAGLYGVGRGDWLLASGLFFIGTVGFTGSIVFSDSLLPHIARANEVDRVSSAGWALGYLGGGILLAVNAFMIVRPDLFGLADAGVATRAAFITVAVWWALFSIPLFRNVSEPPRTSAGAGAGPIRTVALGFGRLRRTFREIRRHREVLKFLLAFWLYADGIGTIIKMATIYGTEIGIGQNSLILALLVVQFVGIPFTFAFGALADRIGAKDGITLALGVYALISLFGYFISEAWHFWVLAGAVGMVQGGAQALSRSLYATIIPKARSSEFFSFYSVFQKFAGILGPFIFAVVGQLMGTSRLGILSLILFFIGGIALLRTVDPEEGRRAAREEDERIRVEAGTAVAK